MPVPKAVRDVMDTIDVHAQRMGDGPYCAIASKMQALSDSINNDETATKRTFAAELMLELPACGGAASVAKYTHEREFMQGLMRRKALELQEYDAHCAAVMGTAWKIELAEALMPYHGPSTLTDVRIGIQNLFLARAGFLPQVVSRLAKLGISPHMLCPRDFGVELCKGDDGSGPTAEDFLFYEPRFLRWILGRGELEPWPALCLGGQPEHVSRLILVANSEGGDDKKINQPCQCPRCWGFRIPTLESSRVSLTPSECSSDSESEMVL
tara:strand:+ start:7298 stop:8101 length:804 start_codon:yes stop_codon:yes gene_type:complete